MGWAAHDPGSKNVGVAIPMQHVSCVLFDHTISAFFVERCVHVMPLSRATALTIIEVIEYLQVWCIPKGVGDGFFLSKNKYFGPFCEEKKATRCFFFGVKDPRVGNNVLWLNPTFAWTEKQFSIHDGRCIVLLVRHRIGDPIDKLLR